MTTESQMTQTSAPVGTVATLGHPANMCLVAKSQSGDWRYLHSGLRVDAEEFRAGWDIYTPEVTR